MALSALRNTVWVLLLLLLLPDSVEAGRGSRSSGGRSGGSFKSSSSGGWGKSSSSSSSRPSSTGSTFKSSTPSTSKPSTTSSWGSRPAASTPARPTITPPARISETDRAAHQKAVQGNSFGGSFSDQNQAREQAIQDFRQKHGKDYTSTFKEQPRTRPEHIPETVSVDGKSRPVEYRTEGGNGGYYYQDTLGRWMLYDLMADSMYRDRYLYRHGYDPTGSVYVQSPHYSSGARSSSSGGGSVIWLGFVVLLLIVLGGVLWYYYLGPGSVQPALAGGRRKEEPAEPPTPATQPAGKSMDTTRVEHWQAIKPGDIVTLKDEQTLEMLMEEKRANFSRGLDLTVQRIQRISEQRDLMKWTLCQFESVRLGGDEENWYLLIKQVDDKFDLRLLFVPEDFTPGSRQQLLDAGVRWLFKRPADEQHFEVGELEYTDEIEQTLNDGSLAVFRSKPQGLLFGSMKEEPKPSGLEQPQFVSLMEYSTSSPCDNPELVLLEVGGVALEDRSRRGGGYLMLLQGANVRTQDLELLRV